MIVLFLGKWVAKERNGWSVAEDIKRTKSERADDSDNCSLLPTLHLRLDFSGLADGSNCCFRPNAQHIRLTKHPAANNDTHQRAGAIRVVFKTDPTAGSVACDCSSPISLCVTGCVLRGQRHSVTTRIKPLPRSQNQRYGLEAFGSWSVYSCVSQCGQT